jgi:hypothetical protein
LDRVLSGTAGVSVSAVEGVGSVVEVVWSSSVAWAARLLFECDRDGTSAVLESANVLTREAQSHSPPQGESSSMVALSECCERVQVASRMRCCLVPSPRRNTPSLAPSPSPSDHYRLPSIDMTPIMHLDLQSSPIFDPRRTCCHLHLSKTRNTFHSIAILATNYASWRRLCHDDLHSYRDSCRKD